MGVMHEGWASLEMAEVGCALGNSNMAVTMGVSLRAGEFP